MKFMQEGKPASTGPERRGTGAIALMALSFLLGYLLLGQRTFYREDGYQLVEILDPNEKKHVFLSGAPLESWIKTRPAIGDREISVVRVPLGGHSSRKWCRKTTSPGSWLA